MPVLIGFEMYMNRSGLSNEKASRLKILSTVYFIVVLNGKLASCNEPSIYTSCFDFDVAELLSNSYPNSKISEALALRLDVNRKLPTSMSVLIGF